MGVSVAYPTLYTDGDPDASGVCSVTVSPPSIFHEMYKPLGGSYSYSQWQAEVSVEACRIQ